MRHLTRQIGLCHGLCRPRQTKLTENTILKIILAPQLSLQPLLLVWSLHSALLIFCYLILTSILWSSLIMLLLGARPDKVVRIAGDTPVRVLRLPLSNCSWRLAALWPQQQPACDLCLWHGDPSRTGDIKCASRFDSIRVSMQCWYNIDELLEKWIESLTYQ